MKLNELRPAEGSSKAAWRKGRGAGSGNGKTAGKGHKGQNARSGGGVRPGFEGGQLPLYRKLPKRGFHNKFATEYAVVNLSTLEKKIVRKPYDGLKVLANGELTKKLTVKAAKFTAAAKEKITAAGGQAEEV